MPSIKERRNPCKQPTGWLGRILLRRMNAHHSKLTDWGLSHIGIAEHDTVLDIGCGGGRTISKLATFARRGKVYGIDLSGDSVTIASKLNQTSIQEGRVEICQGTVSRLPFPADLFDAIAAVETHFWWPDLANDMREVLRVLKPGGKLVCIAEIFRGANTAMSNIAEKREHLHGMKLLTIDEHRDLLSQAGYSDVQVDVDSTKGWICAMGTKPQAAPSA